MEKYLFEPVCMMRRVSKSNLVHKISLFLAAWLEDDQELRALPLRKVRVSLIMVSLYVITTMLQCSAWY